jgi:hypothetical protein
VFGTWDWTRHGRTTCLVLVFDLHMGQDEKQLFSCPIPKFCSTSSHVTTLSHPVSSHPLINVPQLYGPCEQKILKQELKLLYRFCGFVNMLMYSTYISSPLGLFPNIYPCVYIFACINQSSSWIWLGWRMGEYRVSSKSAHSLSYYLTCVEFLMTNSSGLR